MADERQREFLEAHERRMRRVDDALAGARVADLALEAAAEALRAADWDEVEEPDELAKVAVAAYLDSLLGGLPEEAVEAMRIEHYGPGPTLSAVEATCRRLNMEEAAEAFLRSLRSGLERDGE